MVEDLVPDSLWEQVAPLLPRSGGYPLGDGQHHTRDGARFVVPDGFLADGFGLGH